jgi:hypothetical protein
MVDFEAIGEVPDTRTTFIGMGYDNDFVSPVDKLLEYDQYLVTEMQMADLRLTTGICDFRLPL